jgi:hypothetical protein
LAAVEWTEEIPKREMVRKISTPPLHLGRLTARSLCRGGVPSVGRLRHFGKICGKKIRRHQYNARNEAKSETHRDVKIRPVRHPRPG